MTTATISDSDLKMMADLVNNWESYTRILETRDLTQPQLNYWAAKALTLPKTAPGAINRNALLNTAKTHTGPLVMKEDSSLPDWAKLEDKTGGSLDLFSDEPMFMPSPSIGPASRSSWLGEPVYPLDEQIPPPLWPSRPVVQPRGSKPLGSVSTPTLNYKGMANDELAIALNEDGTLHDVLVLLMELKAKGIDPRPYLKRMNESAALRFFIRY